MEKNKKIPCGAAPRTPQRDPQNLCLQGKWMPLTLRSAYIANALLRLSENRGFSRTIDA